jgi:hypothetical protein
LRTRSPIVSSNVSPLKNALPACDIIYEKQFQIINFKIQVRCNYLLIMLILYFFFTADVLNLCLNIFSLMSFLNFDFVIRRTILCIIFFIYYLLKRHHRRNAYCNDLMINNLQEILLFI